MKPLSGLINDKVMEELKLELKKNTFPGITFENAMRFLLTDGVLPASGLPGSSFLKLEDWIRSQNHDQVTFTTTELKNKTGEILDNVLQGRSVLLSKHGRIVAEIKRV